jgi:signal transduction histidine kinase
MRDGDRPLHLRIEATRVDASLRLRIVDDGLGLTTKKLKEGVGLRNTRERLSQLYGENQQMDVIPLANGGFEVTLTLPARAAEHRNIEHGRREIA